MGNAGLRKMPQVLVVGAEGSGKTTLVSGEKTEQPEPTQGYNHFEKNFLDKNSTGKRIGIWDVSGKEALKPLWSSYYKNIHFSGVIFVIDQKQPDLEQSIRDLHYLTNEEELRDSAFLVLFNVKNSPRDFKGRPTDELFDVIRRHELHMNTKVSCFEFNFKSYNEESTRSFQWLYENFE